MSDLLKSINFIKKISISINDVTTSGEANDGYKVVIANYKFESKSFNTKRLFYRNIEKQDYIKNKNKLQTYYNEPVFWLDIEKHDWPHGRGAEIEKTIIDDMIDGEDSDFRNFLLSLANNQKTGHLQILTKKGKPQQYGFNFENNNHWHDIIFLLQKIISNKGEIPSQDEFINLVFNWGNTEPRERVRLKPNHKFILDFSKLIKEYQPKLQATSMINILNYKKQIILQGPPGTGKTRLAKQLASELINAELTVEIIQKELKVNQKIANASGKPDFYAITSINEKNISLKSEQANNNWSPNYNKIIDAFNQLVQGENVENKNGLQPYEIAVAQHFIKHKDWICYSPEFKIIQFHPSYTYEDFVRGIEAQSNGETIEYKSINKTLGVFAKRALDNYEDSKKDPSTISREIKINEYFKDFSSYLSDELEKNDSYLPLTENVGVIGIEEDAFRYKNIKQGWNKLGNRMLFKDILQAYFDDNKERQDLKKNSNLSGLAIQHASYFVRVLNMFQEYLENHTINLNENKFEKIDLKNYVLIIDEINRANLSAVLGELIYALEYRGEYVESMYEVDGKKELILPPNLYIIGTMNTADRSVGHIDYAIRRRFAFVDVLPKDLSDDESVAFATNLYKATELIFNQYITSEFKKKDIQLGHSYFIDKSEEGGSMAIRLQYEIQPILLEYINDGILREEARNDIDKLIEYVE